MARSRTRIVVPPAVPIADAEPTKKPAVFGGGGLSIASFLKGTEAQRTRAVHSRLSDLDVAMQAAASRSKSGEWSGTTGAILVGLYANLHVKLYALRPAELESGVEMRRAAGAAKRILHEHFGDSPDDTVEFVLWAFRREQKLIEWAKSKDIPRNRFVWKFLFSASTVMNYKVESSVRGRR